MAAETVLLLLSFDMRRMTIGALRNKSMLLSMAGAACYRSMRTLVFLELAHLLGMACEARFGDVVRQTDNQGRVRIGVTAETVLKGEMVLPFMTLAASGNNITYAGRMSFMAIDTSYFRLVGPTVAGDVRWWLAMTLDAVVRGQFGGHAGRADKYRIH